MTKDKDYMKLINTSRWQRLRRDILTAHPLCERCEAEGYITPATEVHHRKPVEYGIDYNEKRRLMYDPDNLCALCHDCHVMTKDGLNASTVIMDEFSRARDNSLLTVLTTSMGVRENLLTVIITIQPAMFSTIHSMRCYRGDKTDLLGGFEGDSHFAHIFELDLDYPEDTEDATL